MSRFVSPGVEKLGPQYYRVWWPERGSDRRPSRYVHGPLTKAQALRIAMIDSQARGEYVSPGNLTLGAYLDRWLERHETMGETGASTHTRYRQLLSSVKAHLGEEPLQLLTKSEIEDYYAWCLKHELTRRGTHVCRDTVHKRHVILKRALEDALQEEPPLIQRNPAARAKHPGAARPHGVAFTREEAQVVLAAIHGSWLHTECLIALHTGLRVGEVIALQWRDVDLPPDGGGALTVSGMVVERKGGFSRVPYGKTASARRTLAFGVELGEALRAHRKAQTERRLRLGVAWQDNDLVCAGEYGQLLRPSKVSGRFTPIVRLLEDEGALSTADATFHSLRHTHATLLLRGGTRVEVVSQRLGHSRIQITLDYYAHVIPKDDEAVAESFDEIINASYEGSILHQFCTNEAAPEVEAALL
jgi:integrase